MCHPQRENTGKVPFGHVPPRSGRVLLLHQLVPQSSPHLSAPQATYELPPTPLSALPGAGRAQVAVSCRVTRGEEADAPAPQSRQDSLPQGVRRIVRASFLHHLRVGEAAKHTKYTIRVREIG